MPRLVPSKPISLLLLRWLRVAVLTGVGLLVAWLGVANLLLWTGAVERWVSGEHDFADVELEIGRAWMLRPGTVSVRDLDLRVDGHALRFALHVPEGTANVSVFGLVSRTLALRTIRGHDVTLVLQRKLPAGDVSEQRLAWFPAIGSFGPPVRYGDPPETIPLEETMTVLLEDVDVDLARLWLDEVRIETREGRLVGDLRIAIRHEVSIPGMRLSSNAATVSIADEDPFINELSLLADLRLNERAPHELVERDALNAVSGTVDAQGVVRDIASLARYFPAHMKLALAGGEGPIELMATLNGGVVQPGAYVRYETDAVRSYLGKLVVGARMKVEMAAENEDGGGVMRASAVLEDLHGGLAQTASSRDGVTAPKVEASATLAQTDLTATDWAIVDASASIPRLQVSDLGIFADAFDDIEHLGGEAELSWRTARLADGRHGHDLSVSVRELRVRTAELSLGASVEVDLGARTNVEHTQTTIGKLAAKLNRVAIRTPNGSTNGSWLRVSGGTMTLNHETGRIEGRLRGTMDDLQPMLVHASKRREGKNRTLRSARQALSFDVALDMKRGDTTVVVNDLSRPALNLQGKLRSLGERTRFVFWLRHARIGIYGEEANEHSIDLAVSDEWVARKMEWVDAVDSGSQ